MERVEAGFPPVISFPLAPLPWAHREGFGPLFRPPKPRLTENRPQEAPQRASNASSGGPTSARKKAQESKTNGSEEPRTVTNEKAKQQTNHLCLYVRLSSEMQFGSGAMLAASYCRPLWVGDGVHAAWRLQLY